MDQHSPTVPYATSDILLDVLCMYFGGNLDAKHLILRIYVSGMVDHVPSISLEIFEHYREKPRGNVG